MTPFELDLETVILRSMKFWSRKYAEKVCLEYRKYLNYLLITDDLDTEDAIPTKRVDDFWHLHILDTEKYRKDCALMGEFFDHIPEVPMAGKKAKCTAKKGKCKGKKK